MNQKHLIKQMLDNPNNRSTSLIVIESLYPHSPLLFSLMFNFGVKPLRTVDIAEIGYAYYTKKKKILKRKPRMVTELEELVQ